MTLTFSPRSVSQQPGSHFVSLALPIFIDHRSTRPLPHLYPTSPTLASSGDLVRNIRTTVALSVLTSTTQSTSLSSSPFSFPFAFALARLALLLPPFSHPRSILSAQHTFCVQTTPLHSLLLCICCCCSISFSRLDLRDLSLLTPHHHLRRTITK